MNYRVDLQKRADDDDEKSANNSGEQDQNLKPSWESGKKVRKSYPNKTINHTGEVTSREKTHLDPTARGQWCTNRIMTFYKQQIKCLYDKVILLQK